MKKRCFDPNQKQFKDWGGRGITICERWMIFENFYEDMKKTWTPEENTIDRIDKDGNYEKENCRWLSQSENTRKRNEESGNPLQKRPDGTSVASDRVANGTNPFLDGKYGRMSEGKIHVNNGIIEKKIHLKELQKFLDDNSKEWVKGILPRIKKECLYCHRIFDFLNYSRWHGEKCKNNLNKEIKL